MDFSKKWIAAALLLGLLTPLVWSPLLFNGGNGNPPATTTSIKKSIPTNGMFVGVNTWWNETYRYRTEVCITEPGIKDRVNEPVMLWMSFEEGYHSRNSTRVVKYDSSASTWTEIPSQVWNVTTNGPGTFILSCSITFQATLALSQTAIYFVYYTSEFVENKTAEYQAQSSLQSMITTVPGGPGGPNISAVQVSNGIFNLTMNLSAGISTLEENGKNFHTNNSLSPAPRVQLSSGLIGYWKCNEGSGTVAYDSSGYNNHGTLVSGPTWITGKEGSALYFNGNGPYVNAPISRGDNVTFSLWANYTGALSQTRMLFLAGPAGSGPDLFFYNNHIDWNTWDSDGNPFGNIPASANDGNFHNYVVVINTMAGNTKLYYDGTYVGTAVYKDPSPGGSTIFQIGGSSGYWWKGGIDEVRLYNRSLSAEEVQSLYTDASSVISSIVVDQEGPVFSRYAINWTQSGDMITTDVLTVYDQMPMYSMARTFHWEANRSLVNGNNSWQVFNTFYNGSQYYQPDTFCRFYYDANNVAQWTQNLPFTSENYTIVRGPLDASGMWTSTGVFLTGYSKGNPQIQFSTLRWDSRKVNNLYYLIPGNYTDLDNKQPHLPYDDYNLTLTFWEMLQVGDPYGTDYASASNNFDNIFGSLKQPLSVEIYAANNESRFFSLDIALTDWDGNPAMGVNVTLVNATDNATGWNINSPQPSVLTNAGGIASFTRLVGANYTVNLTYSAYGHSPVGISQNSWGQTNITLNTTQSLLFENVPLTRENLRFQAYDPNTGELKGAIIGGNVSFYTNTSGSLDFVGSTQTDSTGNISFYWVRQDISEANLTFKLDFLGQAREINVTTNEWVNNLTVPIDSQSFLEVGVKMGDYSTKLEDISGNLENTFFWGETLTIRVNFTYSEGVSVGNPITGAIISYQLYSALRGIFNTSVFYESTPPGVYEFNLTTSATWLNLHSSINYYMAVTAERPGYSPQQLIVPIGLNNITTNLVAQQPSIQVYWLDNISANDARFYFNDSLHSSAITGATLKYTVPTMPFITGILRDEGNGWYNFTLNSTEFTYTGTYVLTVTAMKDNYILSTININLQVLQIRTYIAPWTNPNQQQLSFVQTIRINVTTRQVLWFNYTDSLGNGISNAAIAEYEWQDSLGGTHIDFLTDEGNGNYSLDFNTANRVIGTYSIVVTIAQTNYKDRSCVIILTIEPIPITLMPLGFAQGEAVKSPQGEDLVIRVYLEDSFHGGPLTGATVQLEFDGQWRTMQPDATNLGEYNLVLTTAGYNALFGQLDFPAKIRITKDNYTLATDFIFTISIAPPELLGMPMIYWIIAIVAVGAVVGIMLGVKVVKRARIPQIIKDVAATRDLIKKRRSIENIQISPTRAELIHALVKSGWATIGVDLPAPAKKPTEETRPEPEELEEKEASE